MDVDWNVTNSYVVRILKSGPKECMFKVTLVLHLLFQTISKNF